MVVEHKNLLMLMDFVMRLLVALHEFFYFDIWQNICVWNDGFWCCGLLNTVGRVGCNNFGVGDGLRWRFNACGCIIIVFVSVLYNVGLFAGCWNLICDAGKTCA